jgi:Pyruvate/2-oxoacid:ferredoxin oxidoreductase delta subunit
MSYTIVSHSCINCGGCEFACPTEAIRPPAADATHPAVFWIETHRCNDCGFCATVCPTDCILPDPDTIGCAGRGCPIAEDRHGTFAGWECSRLEALCDRCGHVLWRSDSGDEWECVRCKPDRGARRQLCPKVLLLEKAKTGPKPPRRSVEELYANRARAAAERGG